LEPTPGGRVRVHRVPALDGSRPRAARLNAKPLGFYANTIPEQNDGAFRHDEDDEDEGRATVAARPATGREARAKAAAPRR
jgi:hypothetical protein